MSSTENLPEEESNPQLQEVLDASIPERFADIADRYIGQAGQGHFTHQIEDYRLEVAWHQHGATIYCQSELFGPDNYQQTSSWELETENCRQSLTELIAAQLPENNG